MFKPENAFNASMSLKVVDEMSPEELKKRAEVMREGQFNVISEEILRAEIEEIAQGKKSRRVEINVNSAIEASAYRLTNKGEVCVAIR